MMSEQDSFSNPNYKQQITKNVELLREAFKKIDKNSDDMIDEQEIIEFLDSQMQVIFKFNPTSGRQKI